MSGALAERDFAEKLERVGIGDLRAVERRPWSIDDCTRYPLFDDDLIALMRRLLPAARHGAVASAVTITGRKATADDRTSVPIASGGFAMGVEADCVLPHREQDGLEPRMDEQTRVRVHDRYDAGDLGCGDGLPREFRSRLSAIPLGAALEVTVRDPAARADLPPLARMMGHRILSEEAHDDGRLVMIVERAK